jgi:hypothetical protein
MAAKSKSKPNDSATDDNDLDDVLAELRAHDTRDDPTHYSSSSTSTSSDAAALEENFSGEALHVAVNNTEVNRWLAENGLASGDEKPTGTVARPRGSQLSRETGRGSDCRDLSIKALLAPPPADAMSIEHERTVNCQRCPFARTSVRPT